MTPRRQLCRTQQNVNFPSESFPCSHHTQCQADLCRRLLCTSKSIILCKHKPSLWQYFCFIYHLLTGPDFILQLPFSFSFPPTPRLFPSDSSFKCHSLAAAAALLCNMRFFLCGSVLLQVEGRRDCNDNAHLITVHLYRLSTVLQHSMTHPPKQQRGQLKWK